MRVVSRDVLFIAELRLLLELFLLQPLLPFDPLALLLLVRPKLGLRKSLQPRRDPFKLVVLACLLSRISAYLCGGEFAKVSSLLGIADQRGVGERPLGDLLSRVFALRRGMRMLQSRKSLHSFPLLPEKRIC